jgi:hypothetical protein
MVGQKRVLIMMGVNVRGIRRTLDVCLFNEEALFGGRHCWQALTDRFPLWREAL